jgi:hypothetical protein
MRQILLYSLQMGWERIERVHHAGHPLNAEGSIDSMA